jgi:hypothetical protein
MIESSLFLALKANDPVAFNNAIAANLEYLSPDQVQGFVDGHLAALGQ